MHALVVSVAIILGLGLGSGLGLETASAQAPRPGTVDPQFPPELVRIDQTFRQTAAGGPNTDWVYLIIYRPDLNVNYSSPAMMYASILWGNIGNIQSVKSGNATIGHFEYAWSCSQRRLPNGQTLPARAGATGQTGDQDNGSIQMVLNGGGMTPVFIDYMDGYLEGYYEPFDMVNNRIRDGVSKIQMIALAVSPDDCRRVASFTQEYKARGAERRFGLLADPHKFEGGVCWSVAEAAVSHIPIAQSLFDSYDVRFGVPWSLMGRPTSQPRTAVLPRSLRNEGFEYVHIDKFNEAFQTWDDPTQRNYPFRTFDFQNFGREFSRRFAGCERDWCQQTRRARAPIYRADLTSSTAQNPMFVEAMLVDARR